MTLLYFILSETITLTFAFVCFIRLINVNEIKTKIMTTLIPFSSTELTWHLQNNVMPRLTDSTIKQIVQQCKLVNLGEMCLEDEIAEGTGITIADMLEDLHIEYND